ncbi:DUF2267 domain-containing protein [Haloparvum sedimenti]|uniref:DUF2267 domain-containing protein n=1 Tax=Haloparvum sedimenti TaxID=1678448 RepID=UPI00071E88CE|nr:DUF2267 domain-containing protein [Haloparvum sedimenti]
MNFDDFTGEIQHRIEGGTQGEAVRATRTVLSTLGERVDAGGATDLASPLPMEVDRFLLAVEHGQRFDYDEFVERVTARANYDDLDASFGKGGAIDPPDADFHAKAVVALVAEQLPGDQPDQLREQLPDDYASLFEFVDAERTPWEAED